MTFPTLAIRVDVDTYDGAIEGVPRLLELFRAEGVRATWFVSVGPDRWGVAALRLTRPGFLAKMVRTRAPSMYPLKTMLRGTLLPSRSFEELAPLLRSIADAGHEVGLHAWDHVRWQDRLHAWSPDETARELVLARDAFARIFGRAPRAIAAPGWVASAAHLRAQEAFDLLYASDCRASTGPFVPVLEACELRTVQVPVDLPTLDEELGRNGTTAENFAERLVARLVPGRTHVFTVHTEAEGRRYAASLISVLNRARDLGARFTTLEEVVQRLDRSALPRATIAQGELPGRSGFVAVVEPVPGTRSAAF